MHYRMSVYALAISLSLTASLAQASPFAANYTQPRALDEGRSSGQSLFVLEEIGTEPDNALLSQQINYDVRPASVGNSRIIDRSDPSNGNTRLDLRPQGQPVGTYAGTTNSRPNTPANMQGTPQTDSAPTARNLRPDLRPLGQPVGASGGTHNSGSTTQSTPQIDSVPANTNIVSDRATTNSSPNTPANSTQGTPQIDSAQTSVVVSDRATTNSRPNMLGNTPGTPQIDSAPVIGSSDNNMPASDKGFNPQNTDIQPSYKGGISTYPSQGDSLSRPGGKAETGEWRPIVVPPGSSGSTGNSSSPQDNASYGVVGYPVNPSGNTETSEWRPIVVPPGSTGPTGYETRTGKGQAQLQCDAHPTGKGQAQIQCNGVHPTGKGQTQIQCNAHPTSKGQVQFQCDAHPTGKGDAQFLCNGVHPTDSKTMAPTPKLGSPAGAIQLQCNEKGTGIVVCNAHPKTGAPIPVMGAGNNEIPQVQMPNQKGTGFITCNFRPQENTPAIPMIDANNNAIPQIQMPNEKGTGVVICNFYPTDNIPLVPVMDAGHHEIPQVQMPSFEGKGFEMSPGSFEGKGGGEIMPDSGFMK